jgi:predicted dehydrogenase
MVYPTHVEMLANEKLDGIVASQPFTRHGTLIPDLLKAGIPVFTEKPLAGSIEMGERIAAAVNASTTWIMVGYHKRSDPATMAAKAEIERLKAIQELGRMTYIRILMPAGDWVAGGFNDLIRSPEPYPALEWDPPASDMDADSYKKYISFVNYYIHQVNLLRHFLGEPYHVTYADPSGVLLAGQSESSIACTIEMTPYQTSLDWQESALICFEHGYLRLELPAPLASNRPGKLEIFHDPPPTDPGQTPASTSHLAVQALPQTIIPSAGKYYPPLPWIHAMRQQAMNFLAAIRGEIPPMCSAEEALEDLKVAKEYIDLKRG